MVDNHSSQKQRVVSVTKIDNNERLESVRMHFSSKLESVRIGKCQNLKILTLSNSDTLRF